MKLITTPAKYYHLWNSLPHLWNITTCETHYHTCEILPPVKLITHLWNSLPHPWNITTCETHYHTCKILPPVKLITHPRNSLPHPWNITTCETHYLLNYDNLTVAESSNGRWRHTCTNWARRLVTMLETNALSISQAATRLEPYHHVTCLTCLHWPNGVSVYVVHCLDR